MFFHYSNIESYRKSSESYNISTDFVGDPALPVQEWSDTVVSRSKSRPRKYALYTEIRTLSNPSLRSDCESNVKLCNLDKCRLFRRMSSSSTKVGLPGFVIPGRLLATLPATLPDSLRVRSKDRLRLENNYAQSGFMRYSNRQRFSISRRLQ